MTVKERILEWLDTKLIPDWDGAMKFASVKALSIMGTLATGWIALTDEQRAGLASLLGIDPAWLVVAGVIVAIYQRLKAQPELYK